VRDQDASVLLFIDSMASHGETAMKLVRLLTYVLAALAGIYLLAAVLPGQPRLRQRAGS
jgi:hypothetical protein